MFVPYVYAYVMSITSMVSHMRCHTHGPVYNISNVWHELMDHEAAGRGRLHLDAQAVAIQHIKAFVCAILSAKDVKAALDFQ